MPANSTDAPVHGQPKKTLPKLFSDSPEKPARGFRLHWAIGPRRPLRPPLPLTTGGTGCGSVRTPPWVLLSPCCRVKAWTMWTPTFWSALYNPAHPEFLNAYLRGRKHKDLRFFVRNRVGAVPQLDSPEEVALVNYDPKGMEDGVWYLAHLKSEYLNHTASSREDRRLFATRRYKIETVIA